MYGLEFIACEGELLQEGAQASFAILLYFTHMAALSLMHSVRRRGKKRRLVVEVESLASSRKKSRRVDVKA